MLDYQIVNDNSTASYILKLMLRKMSVFKRHLEHFFSLKSSMFALALQQLKLTVKTCHTYLQRQAFPKGDRVLPNL